MKLLRGITVVGTGTHIFLSRVKLTDSAVPDWGREIHVSGSYGKNQKNLNILSLAVSFLTQACVHHV